MGCVEELVSGGFSMLLYCAWAYLVRLGIELVLDLEALDPVKLVLRYVGY